MATSNEPAIGAEDSSLSTSERVEAGKIVSVPKQKRLSPELPTFDDAFYAWKKNFWRERIGPIKYVVAPMVDQSELAFRMFLRERGAAHLCFTPMIHANLFVSDSTYRQGAFSTIQAVNAQFNSDSANISSNGETNAPSDRPLIVQFCANDPRILLDACRLVEGYCDGVDLNLGCPQLIAKRGRYGSFLQEFPDLIAEMVGLVHAHCRLPISVKIRALASIDATVSYARKLADAGASMITVHGRVREQRGVHTGLADWRHITAVKRAVDIPVIANGNVQLFGDVEHCLRVTGADAVMSAEGILNNPLLFTGKNVSSFAVARDYLSYAARYQSNVSAIRAHVFRICHHSLLKHDDLREKTSYVFKISEFRGIVNELEQRFLSTDAPGDDNHHVDGGTSARGVLSLVLDEESQLKLVGQSLPSDWLDNAPSPSEENENVFAGVMDESLLNLVNSMPAWVCKPYVRPFRQQNAPDNGSNESGTVEASNPPVVSAYRAARREEMSRLVAETGLSKRQLRKRERRRVEAKRKAHVALNDDGDEANDAEEIGPKKRRYPPCQRCSLPAGANCEMQLCKRCCKLTCVRMARDCKVHGFSHEKMHEKRVNYAQRVGITLEQLLQKETQDFERQKFLKNVKKTPLDFHAMHRDEAQRRIKNINEPTINNAIG